MRKKKMIYIFLIGELRKVNSRLPPPVHIKLSGGWLKSFCALNEKILFLVGNFNTLFSMILQ